MPKLVKVVIVFLLTTLGIILCGDSPADSPFVTVGPDKKLQAPRLKDVRVVDPLPEAVDWKLEVTPYTGQKVISKDPIPLDVPAGDLFRGFAMNHSGDRAVVGHTTKGGNSTKLISCDLAKGSVSRRLEVPGLWGPVAVSDDGVHAVLRRWDNAKGKKDTLQIWNIAEKVPSLQLEFSPHPTLSEMNRDIRAIAWLPNDRLLTVCNTAMVVWDLKTGKGIYWLHMQLEAYPSLSPDRKRLAFTTKTSVGILDVDEGKVLVSQPVPETLPSVLLAFNPDGTRIACRTPEHIYIWKVSDGSLYRDIPKADLPGNVFRWTSPKDLLVGTHLVDVELPLHYWEYKGTFGVQSNNGATWFLTPGEKDKGGGAMVPAEIPRVDALQALKKATSDPDVLVLKSGTRVKLDVSGVKDVEERVRTTEALTKALEKNGFKVDPKGTITLAASTDFYPEPIELKYRQVEKKGDKDGPIKLYKFQVHFARLRFVYNQKSIWESSSHNLPGDIELEVGESAEARLKKHEKPKYEFFQTAELPKVLLRTKSGNVLGSSLVSPAGIR